MAEGLADALSRLESLLVRSRAAIVPLLHPGIDEAEVTSLLASVGLSPSAEFVTWFGWHDRAGSPGVSGVVAGFVPGGEFYELRHLCDEYVMTRSAASDVGAMPGGIFGCGGALAEPMVPPSAVVRQELPRGRSSGGMMARRRPSTSTGMTAIQRRGLSSPGRAWPPQPDQRGSSKTSLRCLRES
jgi:hypothetical protein